MGRLLVIHGQGSRTSLATVRAEGGNWERWRGSCQYNDDDTVLQ